jgi:hypothetical protein
MSESVQNVVDLDKEISAATQEISDLDRLAKKVFYYLSVLAIAGLFGGYWIVQRGNFEYMIYLLGVALIGLSGSSIAALSSSLDRYATGYELESGTKVPKPLNDSKNPKNDGKETFNARMSEWFFFRPIVGFLIAPVFLWGITFLVKNPDAWREHVAFTAFLGGLLAKSVIDLIKNLFKNVFRA